jgi:hypothetical protein
VRREVLHSHVRHGSPRLVGLHDRAYGRDQATLTGHPASWGPKSGDGGVSGD